MTALPAKSLSLYWVDAFTREPFKGNPAVVVPQADGLTQEQMQQIAREVNCSETAFVRNSAYPGADIELRWFTPKMEVDLCGHATVAAMHVLVGIGRFKISAQSRQTVNLQTRSGLLSVDLEATDAGSPWIWLTLPPCQFQPLDAVHLPSFCAYLDLADPSFVPMPVVDSLNRDVLLPVPSLQQLHQLQPDMSALAKLASHQGWRGICVYSQETIEPENAAHLRFFAPHCGIPEDPVTGSVSGPLVSYLQQTHQLLDVPGPVTLEQGDGMGRAGRVQVQIQAGQMQIGGQATTVIQGELYL